MSGRVACFERSRKGVETGVLKNTKAHHLSSKQNTRFDKPVQ